MNAPWLSRWIGFHHAKRLYRIGLALLVLAVLLARVRSGVAHIKPGDTEVMPQLDSFSEPALAGALLKIEVNHLFDDFAEGRVSQPPKPEALHEPTAPGYYIQLARLQELHRVIEELDADVDRKLMTAYELHTTLPEEFLDRFIDRLGVPADDPYLAFWAEHAFLVATQHQRGAELIGSVQNFTRFHPRFKVSTNLTRILREWQDVTNPAQRRILYEPAS